MPAKKILLVSLASLFLALLLYIKPVTSEAVDTSSDHYDKITKELADLKDALGKSIAATKPLQSELDRMQKQIQSIKTQVASVEYDTQIKNRKLTKGTKHSPESSSSYSIPSATFTSKATRNLP